MVVYVPCSRSILFALELVLRNLLQLIVEACPSSMEKVLVVAANWKRVLPALHHRTRVTVIMVEALEVLARLFN